MLVDGQKLSATEQAARDKYARVGAGEKGYRVAEQLLMFDVHRQGYSVARAVNDELRAEVHGGKGGFFIPVGFRVFAVRNPDEFSWDVFLGDEAGEFIGSVIGLHGSEVSEGVRVLWEAYAGGSRLFRRD